MTDLTLNVPHGYRLNPGTDLLDLAARLRETMEPIRDRIEIEQIAEFAAKALDAADLAGTPRPESVIFDAVQAQTVHVGQILSGEHSCAPNMIKVAVTDDPETGEVYALVFPKQQAFAQELDEMELGDYYPYWKEEDVDQPRPTGVSPPNGRTGQRPGPGSCAAPTRWSPRACSPSKSAPPTRTPI
ncbi:hypothetical protein B1A87_007140 [Arthrobacter sp. KBS0703]|uniref:hypothetical protein n=1 Tax=Arthrobacter sp. KBS0703 TaxID=1955698 RepID=UPI00098F1D9C|nr:hypothetical protein [Arthrobacter sp. KBS0703]TSE15710.1 hypothetical protein B1A87_007140 [Arthrobacter sp. KBS0703]